MRRLRCRHRGERARCARRADVGRRRHTATRCRVHEKRRGMRRFFCMSVGLARFLRQHGDEFEANRVAARVGGVHIARRLVVGHEFPARVVVAQFVFTEGEGERHLAGVVGGVHRRDDEVVAAGAGVRLDVGEDGGNALRVEEHEDDGGDDVVVIFRKGGAVDVVGFRAHGEVFLRGKAGDVLRRAGVVVAGGDVMPGERQVERVAPLTATEVKRLARRHGVARGDDGGMGAGHAVFFGEVVGGFAVKFELHLCVVIKQLHAVPLLRVYRPYIAFRGEDVRGDGRAVFRQFVEFEATGEHAQFAPGTGLGVVLVGDGGRDGVFRPHGHGCWRSDCLCLEIRDSSNQ